MKRGDWIETHSGGQFYPLSPNPDDIHIRDIARSLSMQCRYTGHVNKFYSVAEHCCLIHDLLVAAGCRYEPFVGLMHDATEAYVSDVPLPIKRMIPEFGELEALVWDAITWKFSLPTELPACVRDLDRRMVLAERKHLKVDSGHEWNVPGEMPDVKIHCWSPAEAETQFLARFYEWRQQ